MGVNTSILEKPVPLQVGLGPLGQKSKTQMCLALPPNETEKRTIPQQTTIVFSGDLNIKLQALGILKGATVTALLEQSVEHLMSQLTEAEKQMLSGITDLAKKWQGSSV